MRTSILSPLCALAGLALAHDARTGSHLQKPMVDENADWMTKHMAGTCL